MKSGMNNPSRHFLSIFSALIMLVILISAQQGFGEASLIGTWEEGTSHAKVSGTNRLLIFIANAEHNAATSLTSVTYGNQAMIKVVDEVTGTSGFRNYTAAFILGETGIGAATTDTFVPTWSATPSSVSYASVFLENVNQTDPNGAEDSAITTSGTDPISTGSLATEDGDMVILGVNCGNNGSYTLLNGFTEGTDQSVGTNGNTGAAGHKSATGGPETPSADFDGTVNRQVIIGFVVNGTAPDPNIATNPNPGNGASNVSVSTSLSWDAPTAFTPTSYDVYFGTDTNAHNNPKYKVYTESYDPPGDLNEATPYYWAVDSNDGGTMHPGNPWSFTTLIPVPVKDLVAGNMILLNDNGGWCWYQDDKVIYDPVSGDILTSTAADDTGFLGAGGGRTLDVDVTVFNIDTGTRTRSLQADYGNDDHNMGAFWIRPDGRYLHVYGRHNSNDLTYYRTSTNPHDGSSWAGELNYDWSTISGISGGTLTYTNLHYLSAEGTGSGRLYNIVRWNNSRPNISYSDDLGVTWHYGGLLSEQVGPSGYSYYYHKFRGNGVDRIDFICTEQHPRNYNNNVYHGYIKGGKSYDSYDNVIDVNIFDQDAPGTDEFTRIFAADQNQTAGTYHTGWTNELELDKNGYPVCLYQTRYGTEPWGDGSGQNNIGAADHRFFYARFDGSAWTSTELCKLGVGLHEPEQDYTGMGCIHPDDVNIVYVATQFDPCDDTEYECREIFKGVTSDNGLHWDWTQITFDSTQNNTRPAIPPWDANNTAVVWTRGNWQQTSYENYDLTVMGLVEQEGVTLGKVSYIDADEINTKEADDSPFTPTGPSGSAGAADSQWHEYTGYGNGGSAYTAGDGGTENAPAIKTTISGLADGTYDVFAYFWCDPAQDWGIRGGFTSAESDMLCFSRQSAQFAEASQFSGSVIVEDDEAILYRVYIGRKEISGGASIDVYLDNYDSTYNYNAPTRTTYDGVGVALVITGCIPGDLNCNGEVDLIDFAILGEGWLDAYDYDTLADLADNWLYGK